VESIYKCQGPETAFSMTRKMNDAAVKPAK
jgi:hypothetical protein